MATQYACLHTEKRTGNGGNLGHHIDRTEGYGHTYRNADPAYRHLNQNIQVNEYCKMKLPQALEKCLSDGYLPGVPEAKKKAIRKDAVKWVETVLYGSHEQLNQVKQDPRQLQQWIDANLQFAKEEFGERNICRFTVHLDERTPHIHVVHVPLTKDGRLSAKEMVGNRQDMIDRQTRYAQAMAPFGLQRGVRGSKAQHETLREYYSRVEQIEATTEATKPKRYDRTDILLSGTAEINRQLQQLHAAVLAARLEIDKRDRRTLVLERTNKDKDIEIEKQKKAQVDVIQEKHKTLRAFGYTKELLAKVKLGHELKPDETAFIEKSVVQYQDTLKKQAIQDEYAKKANQEIQDQERRKGLGL